MKTAAFLCSTLLLVSCGTTPPAPPPQPVVVLNDAKILKDGEMASWKIEPGNYRLELTASGEGVEFEWIGSSCVAASEVKQLNTQCKLERQGQLVVRNRPILGLDLGRFNVGSALSVTIKIEEIRQ